VVSLVLGFFCVSCGNYNNTIGVAGTVTGGNGSASGLQERVFASYQNPTSSFGIQVLDASKDQPVFNSATLTPFAIALGGSSPQLMIPGANATTILFDLDGTVSIVDNTKEAIAASETGCSTGSCIPSLPGTTESLVASSDGKFAYAAIRALSQVSILALTAGPPITVTNIPATPANCTATKNCLPGAHRLVLSHNNAKLLVFNEDLPNQFEVIDTASTSSANNGVTTITSPNLDHPIFAVFSSDDSKAYILNCGAECAGTQAGISVFDVASMTITQTVNVDAATVGTADGTNLYVAGSNPATPGAGSATILPLSSLTGGKQVKIGDGFHQVITLFQNKVLIGARICTTGCVSIVDPSGGTAIVDSPKGDVTAITGVTPRSVFYTAEGGGVHVYDVATGNEHLLNNNPAINVVGKVTGVLYVGPKT
jgi:hypothetical protein